MCERENEIERERHRERELEREREREGERERIKIPIRWRPRVIWWATEPITPRPDLTSLTTYPSTPPERDTHLILILASART